MSMTPVPYRVVARREETADTVTLDLVPRDAGLARWHPGQFTMVYAFGVGEVPISVSGGAAGGIRHTVRAVGAVSRAICTTAPGSVLGLRGPYGRGWRLPERAGADLLVIAGGIGLAPLRPVVLSALTRRARFGAVTVLIGARTPDDLIFTDEYDTWRGAGARVLVTVDRADSGWTGHVGVVTTLLDEAGVRPESTRAYVCGPDVMMRYAARDVTRRGVRPEWLQVSLERNMRCGIALCGHCQLGPLIICRDGPVVGYERARPLMETREL
ncbi:MAG TPA: FAD/NAD(P)-binding protein [Micromonosporaceae bacterium]|jgi:NAD(P)H-flavin reductase|nr:FAD/NAD(P)-binding protein [Micromonosporaceae bacterium]